MLEKISWIEIAVAVIGLGAIFYISFLWSFIKTALFAFRSKVTWSNIKKILYIFK